MNTQQFQELRDKIADKLSESSDNLESLKTLRIQLKDLERAVNLAFTEANARTSKLEILSRL